MSKLVRRPQLVKGATPPPTDSLFLADNRAEFEDRLFRLAKTFSVITYRYSGQNRRRVIERQEYEDFAYACIMAVSIGDDAMVYAIGGDEAFGLGCMLPRSMWGHYLKLWREMKVIPSAFSEKKVVTGSKTGRVTSNVKDHREGEWDWTLEGTKCSVCNGTGSVFEQGDAHRSPGTVPCPRSYFQGHGFPVCRKGRLRFSDYDKRHWPGLQVGETMNNELWLLIRPRQPKKKTPLAKAIDRRNKKGKRK